jgi:hypothetical protein
MTGGKPLAASDPMKKDSRLSGLPVHKKGADA